MQQMPAQQPPAVVRTIEISRASMCGSVPGKQGPTIEIEYEVSPSKKLVRHAAGRTMRRSDVHDGTGWHDWAQQDFVTRQTRYVGGQSDKSKVAPIGTAAFNRISATRNCLECHSVSGTRVIPEGAGAEINQAVLTKLGPVEASLGARLVGHGPRSSATRLPSKTDVCATPYRPPVVVVPPDKPPQVVQGPQGPPGRDGRNGIDGRPGKDADMAALSLELRQWLEVNLVNMKGPAGKDGSDGRDGVDGGIGPIGPQGPPGKDASNTPITLHVHFLGNDGSIALEQTVEFLNGEGTLKIPPVKLNIYDDLNGDNVMSESETFRLVEPLGTPLKVEVTGGINARTKAGGK